MLLTAHILSFVDYSDVIAVRQVCRLWWRATKTHTFCAIMFRKSPDFKLGKWLSLDWQLLLCIKTNFTIGERVFWIGDEISYYIAGRLMARVSRHFNRHGGVRCLWHRRSSTSRGILYPRGEMLGVHHHNGSIIRSMAGSNGAVEGRALIFSSNKIYFLNYVNGNYVGRVLVISKSSIVIIRELKKVYKFEF